MTFYLQICICQFGGLGLDFMEQYEINKITNVIIKHQISKNKMMNVTKHLLSISSIWQ